MTGVVSTIKDALKKRSAFDLAQELGINNAHVYRAKNGDVTPMMRDAMIKAGYIDPPKKRRRAAIDIPDHFTEQDAHALRLMVRAFAGEAVRMMEGK